MIVFLSPVRPQQSQVSTSCVTPSTFSFAVATAIVLLPCVSCSLSTYNYSDPVVENKGGPEIFPRNEAAPAGEMNSRRGQATAGRWDARIGRLVGQRRRLRR